MWWNRYSEATVYANLSVAAVLDVTGLNYGWNLLAAVVFIALRQLP